MNPQQPSKIVTLTPQSAQQLYFDNFPLKYVVTEKFARDHLTTAQNLSKRTSIDDAIKRYQRDQAITTSSWTLLTKETLLNKARNARKVASVHRGSQQLTMEIKVTRRTVSIQKLTYKEKDRYVHESVPVRNETHYLSCSSDEKEIKICVMGTWNPITGTVELYHYQESPLPANAAVLPNYLRFRSGESGPPIPLI